jgi:glycosyltransferase involved in cell wall biosynthesis
MAQENSKTPLETVREKLNTYLRQIRAVAVSVSPMKQQTWGVSGPVIPFYIDGDFFSGYAGGVAEGLRVANQISKKSLLLNWPLHHALCTDIPIKIVGYNPGLPGVRPAKDVYELRDFYRSRRFYVHTAQYDYEDGYNTAALEAMACGMPLVCNAHPSAPVENGINGFVSDDISELRENISRLLSDRQLAQKLGRAARQTVLEQNSLRQFRRKWEQAIELAIDFFQGN